MTRIDAINPYYGGPSYCHFVIIASVTADVSGHNVVPFIPVDISSPLDNHHEQGFPTSHKDILVVIVVSYSQRHLSKAAAGSQSGRQHHQHSHKSEHALL
jgi:hypothetical protein